MPRTARASAANWVYHVTNRGNGRAEVFHKDEEYAAFVRIMGDACERSPLRILGYCLIPNYFHLVLWPRHDGDLSRWMQWLLTCHVRRYHRHCGGSGHVWQGRFKAFPSSRTSTCSPSSATSNAIPSGRNSSAGRRHGSGEVCTCGPPAVKANCSRRGRWH